MRPQLFALNGQPTGMELVLVIVSIQVRHLIPCNLNLLRYFPRQASCGVKQLRAVVLLRDKVWAGDVRECCGLVHFRIHLFDMFS